ncbi:MAG: hypothetical protein RRY22_04240 [Bacilli bacterium]
MKLKLNEVIEFIKSKEYDVNEKRGEIIISDKENYYTLITINRIKLIKAIQKQKNT